jgi:hypothetical protein
MNRYLLPISRIASFVLSTPANEVTFNECVECLDSDYSDCACSNAAYPTLDNMDELKFVNRENEQTAIYSATHRLILVDAPAGYGKTRLLFRVKEKYARDGWKCAYIDLFEISTLRAFRRAIWSAIGLDSTVSMTSVLESDWGWKERLGQTGDKLILLVDAIREADPEILAWFQNELDHCLRGLPETSFRVIVAGRYVNAVEKSARLKNFRRIELGDFTEEIVEEVVKASVARFPAPNREFTNNDYDEWAKLLFSLSGGHPGVIDKLIRQVFANKWVLPTKLEEQRVIFETHVKQELTGVKSTLDKETCDLLDVIFVFRRFNLASIDALKVDGYLSDELDSLTAIKQLTKHGLISKPSASLFYSDKLVRNLFLTQLKLFATDKYQKLNQTAQNLYDRLVQEFLNGDHKYDKSTPDDFVDVCITESIYHTCQVCLSSPNFIDLAKICLERHSQVLERAMGHSKDDPGRKQYLRDLIEDDKEICANLKEAGHRIDSLFNLPTYSYSPTKIKPGISESPIPNSVSGKAEELTTQQRKQFAEALGEAFDVSEIKRLLTYELGVTLEEITSVQQTRSTIIGDIVEYFHKAGELLMLVEAAFRKRSKNPALRKFVQNNFPHLFDGQESPQT